MGSSGTDPHVVVGVDGSQPSITALRWAARRAELTGATLRAVTAWEYPTTCSWSVAISADIAAATGTMLSEAVLRALGPQPPVQVRESGHPATRPACCSAPQQRRTCSWWAAAADTRGVELADDIETIVGTALHEIAPDAGLSALHPDADLRETLGLDCLDFLRLVELLSTRTGHRIDEEDYPCLATLAGAVSFLSWPPHR